LIKIITNLFKGHARSVRVKKNIIGVFGLKIISIITNFIYVPLLLNYLTAEKYGIWLTLSSMIAWIGFFDIGLGKGLRNKLAEAIALNNIKLAKEYISTTYATLSLIFLCILIVFYVINPFLHWSKILNTVSITDKELSLLAIVVFTFSVLNFIFNLINQILLADQRTILSQSFRPIGNILALAVIYILTIYSKGSLVIVACVITSIPVVLLIVGSIYLFYGAYKEYKPELKFINFKHSRLLMNLGGKFFLIQITSIVLFTTSNFIITQVLGPEEVATYDIAFKLFNLPVMIFAITLTPIWSAYTEAFVKNDFSWIKKTIQAIIELRVNQIPYFSAVR